MIKTFILVDDDSTTNFINERIIAKWSPGSKVVSFLEADRAIDYLEENDCDQPALVLLDINMPLIDGYQFLEEIKKRDLDRKVTAVAMLTSSIYGKDFDRSKAFPKVLAFIHKPLSKSSLLKINELMLEYDNG